MSVPIAPISVPSLIPLPQSSAAGSTDTSFGQVFSSAVQQVETANATADAAAQNFLSGGTQELHSTILAGASAELDFELFMQVRNKVVSAYEEVMKMQV
ncbi:MAG TPA: flagellar hook-basal body complex protein FliE [Bryobacteraceae bacterium]|jgi:flagellar hook-basal body complex protein FliE|nr:flagellar hook-basal body complex protein FliE [Bryobacteraceae bacterium]